MSNSLPYTNNCEPPDSIELSNVLVDTEQKTDISNDKETKPFDLEGQDVSEPYTIPWLIWLWYLNVIENAICDIFIGENPHNISVDWNTIPSIFHNLFRIPYIA